MGNLQRRFVGRFGLFDQTIVHWKFHKGTTIGRTTKALSAAHFANSLETLKKNNHRILSSIDYILLDLLNRIYFI